MKDFKKAVPLWTAFFAMVVYFMFLVKFLSGKYGNII